MEKKYILCGLLVFFMLGIISARAQLGRAENNNDFIFSRSSYVVMSKSSENSTCTLPKQCPVGLICSNHTCRRCVTSADCGRFDTLCKEKNGTNWCVHKGPLPISWHDGLGYAILSIASAVAGAAGMGGGPLFVPVLIFIFNFDTEYAIPLSKILILGVAVSNFVLNVAQTDPAAPNEWLIKYDVALLFLPLTLFGTTVGV